MRPQARWRFGPSLFATRPRLAISLVIGLVVGFACALAFSDWRASSCAIAGWDMFCAVFITLTLREMAGRSPAEIRDRSALLDQGQAIILVLVLAACAASIATAALELSLAKSEHGLGKAARVLGAILTVAGSWFVMQITLALHYAHEFYARSAETGKDTGGLDFPGRRTPDYWDFLHFSIIIGVANQTADIRITDHRLRQLSTIHSLIAFVFNTLILALTINLAAGLF